MIFQNVWISCQQAVYMMDLQSCRKKCSKSYVHSEVFGGNIYLKRIHIKAMTRTKSMKF